jgi:hypothetical protein
MYVYIIIVHWYNYMLFKYILYVINCVYRILYTHIGYIYYNVYIRYNYIYCVSKFPLLLQNTWNNHLREERLSLAHGFRDFSPWYFDSVAFGLVAGYLKWQGNTSQGKLFTSWSPGSRERKEGSRTLIFLSRHVPNDLTSFNQLYLWKGLWLPNNPRGYRPNL